MPVIHLGAYGTGTNWASRTLQLSGAYIYRYAYWDSRIDRPVRHFFKHYIIERDTLSVLRPPDDALFVCLVKSPLFWISSLRRMVAAGLVPAREMSTLSNVDAASFIRAPGTMVGARRESEGSAFVHYENLPDLWNRYARGYLRYLPAERVQVLPYEAAVRDPQAAFGAILDRLGIPRSALKIHTERRFDTGHDLAQAQAYYGDDRNRTSPYGDEDIAFVNEKVDPESLTALGYQPDGSL